jgi:hypothetical protein
MKTSPLTAHIPVILWSVVDFQDAGIEPAADAYLLKPASRDTLLNLVTRLTNA